MLILTVQNLGFSHRLPFAIIFLKENKRTNYFNNKAMQKSNLILLIVFLLGNYSYLNAQFKKGQTFVTGGFGFTVNGLELSQITSGQSETSRHYFSLNAGAGKLLSKNTAMFISSSFGRSRYQSIKYTILADTTTSGMITEKELQDKYISFSRDLNFSIGIRRYFPIDKKILALIYGRLNWNANRSRSIENGYEKINPSKNIYSIVIDPGLCYLLNKRFGLEAFLQGFSLDYTPKSKYGTPAELSGRFRGTGSLNIGLFYYLK